MTSWILNPTLTMRWSASDGRCLLIWTTRCAGPRAHRVCPRVAEALRQVARGTPPLRLLDKAALDWLRAAELLVTAPKERPHYAPQWLSLGEPATVERPRGPVALGPNFELRFVGDDASLLELSPWGGTWASWRIETSLAPAIERIFAGHPAQPPAEAALLQIGALATVAAHRRREDERWRWFANARTAYQRRGYALLDRWPARGELTALQEYAAAQLDRGYLDGDFGPGGKQRNHIYDDPALRELHARAADLASALTGSPLVPSYSFLSMYLRGGALPRHRDKAHCTVSMSLALEADPTWPLWLEDLDGHASTLYWSTGQIALFDGRRFVHARPPLPAARACYLILHFQPDPEALR